MAIPQNFILLICLIFLFLSHACSKSSPSQPYRTGYHFQPSKNWMNDPNGPMIYKGLYHLFYQYNPRGASWGNIVWAHSTSTDLVNWQPHDAAIYPSEPFDIKGCWSGSATILPSGKPAIFYTGLDLQERQLQNLAFPKNLSDPFLTEWVKIRQNPLMSPTLANQINASAFRDPTTAWLGPDKKWRLIVGSRRNQRGLAILYRSRDFLRWSKAKHPLHTAQKTGMWECPDFFPVSVNSHAGLDTSTAGFNVKHILKVSLDDTKKEYYTIGTYSHEKDVYVPDEGSVEGDFGLRYDYGKFYASKTFFDSTMNRRILWGWINESSNPQHDFKGWSGLQAVPRTLWLDKTGKQLVLWPIEELKSLRAKQVTLPRTVLEGGTIHEVLGVTAAQADIEVTFGVTDLKKAEFLYPSWIDAQALCRKMGTSNKGGFGPFGLLVLASKGLQEFTAVYFRIFRARSPNNKYAVLLCSDQSRSSLRDDYDKANYGTFVNVDDHTKLSLRTLIDHSIVETFAGDGKACITARVYPTLAVDGDARLYVVNYGNQTIALAGRAWSMRTANINQWEKQ